MVGVRLGLSGLAVPVPAEGGPDELGHPGRGPHGRPGVPERRLGPTVQDVGDRGGHLPFRGPDHFDTEIGQAVDDGCEQ